MSDLRADWRASMLRHRAPGMTGDIRCLMLWLADELNPETGRRYMKANGTVSIPQETIAGAFGVPKSRISERIKKAHELELLVTIKRGVRGTTAVYQGCIPAVAEARGWRGDPSNRRQNRPPTCSVATEQESRRESVLLVPSARNQSTSSVATEQESEPDQAGLVPSRRGATSSAGLMSPDNVEDPSGPGPDDDFSKSKRPGEHEPQTEPFGLDPPSSWPERSEWPERSSHPDDAAARDQTPSDRDAAARVRRERSTRELEQLRDELDDDFDASHKLAGTWVDGADDLIEQVLANHRAKTDPAAWLIAALRNHRTAVGKAEHLLKLAEPHADPDRRSA